MNELKSIKVVFLGDSGVDKQGIISQIAKHNSGPQQLIPFIGTSIPIIIEFPDLRKSIKLEIWNIAGQEKCKSFNKKFYQDANIVIFVYDITKRDTFESIKNYWYEIVKNNSNNNPILAVVANKSDLYENSEVNDYEGEEFAYKIGAIFQATSVSQNFGISSLFNNIVRTYLIRRGRKLLSLNKYLNL